MTEKKTPPPPPPLPQKDAEPEPAPAPEPEPSPEILAAKAEIAALQDLVEDLQSQLAEVSQELAESRKLAPPPRHDPSADAADLQFEISDDTRLQLEGLKKRLDAAGDEPTIRVTRRFTFREPSRIPGKGFGRLLPQAIGPSLYRGAMVVRVIQAAAQSNNLHLIEVV